MKFWRQYMEKKCLLLLSTIGYFVPNGLTNGNNLSLLENCVCPGQDVMYQCTVCGGLGGSTEWKGSLFKCSSGNINLRHRTFKTLAVGDCNYAARNISAKNIGPGVFDSSTNLTCYTSQLYIENITVKDNNNTVMCVHVESESNETIVDTASIMVTTDPTPLPTNIFLSDVTPLHMKLSWNSMILTSPFSCSSIKYIIYSIGDCTSIPLNTVYTNTTITYTNLSTVDKNCSIFLQTEICGSISGAMSNPIQVTLKVLEPPVLTHHYYSSQSNSVVVFFNETETFLISDGVFGSATHYTIMFMDTASHINCGSIIIPSSDCTSSVCSVSYPLLKHTSNCSQSNNISVSAYATNVLGNGPSSLPVFVQITADRQENASTQPSLTSYIIIAISAIVVGILIIVIITLIIVLVLKAQKNYRPDHDKQPSRNLATHVTEDQNHVLYAEIGPSNHGKSINLDFNGHDAVEYAEIKPQPEAVNPGSTIKVSGYQLNLDNLLIQIGSQVTPLWYEFGQAVGISKEVLDKCLGYPAKECIVEVLDYWVRHKYPQPTWKDVADGLKVIGLLSFANDILEIYKTGNPPVDSSRLPTNRDTTVQQLQVSPPLPPKSA